MTIYNLFITAFSLHRSELIYKRNRRMARRIGDLLEGHHNKTYVFACGAGKSTVKRSSGPEGETGNQLFNTMKIEWFRTIFVSHYNNTIY